MSKRHHSPYTVRELNQIVEHFRGTQENRVHEYRLKKHTVDEKKSTKTDWWDMPLTVCSCGTTKRPFISANGRNCSALKTPHPVLSAAYRDIEDDKGLIIGSIAIGTKPDNNVKSILGLKGKDSWEAGRCAEPHAVNRLLNEARKMSATFGVSDILFSHALDARYPIPKPYCVTCKCVFPQLRKQH